MARSELVYGVHAVRHALSAAPATALELWVQQGTGRRALAEIAAAAERAGVTAQHVPRATLDRLTGGRRHQGVVLRRRPREAAGEGELWTLLEAIAGPALVLVLDGLNDPHNLGACLRVADAAGAHAVVVPLHRGPGLTPAARKVASGAAESVPLLRVRNLARVLRGLGERGITRIGTVAEPGLPALYELDLTGPLALVLGAEDAGLRRLTREHCDRLAAIPMAGVVESLNLSVTAGIGLYEAVRQRRGSPRA